MGPHAKGFVPVPVIVALQHLATVYVCKHVFRALKENMGVFYKFDFAKAASIEDDHLERYATAMARFCPLGESLEDILQCDLFAKLLMDSGKYSTKKKITVVRKGCMTVTLPKVKQMLSLAQEKHSVEIERHTAPLVKRLAFHELMLSKLSDEERLSYQETFLEQGPNFRLTPFRNEDQGPLLDYKEASEEEAQKQMLDCGIVTNSIYRQILISSGVDPDCKVSAGSISLSPLSFGFDDDSRSGHGGKPQDSDFATPNRSGNQPPGSRSNNVAKTQAAAAGEHNSAETQPLSEDAKLLLSAAAQAQAQEALEQERAARQQAAAEKLAKAATTEQERATRQQAAAEKLAAAQAQAREAKEQERAARKKAAAEKLASASAATLGKAVEDDRKPAAKPTGMDAASPSISVFLANR